MIGLLFTLAEIGKNTRSYYDKLTYNSINYKPKTNLESLGIKKPQNWS